jgi:hypothetical protein
VFAEGRESRLREHQRAWLTPLLAHEPVGASSLGADVEAHDLMARWLEHGAVEWQSDTDDDD